MKWKPRKKREKENPFCDVQALKLRKIAMRTI